MEKKIKHARVIQNFFSSYKILWRKYKKKLMKTSAYLKKEKADYIFSQNSESIAWLFNMRGADLPHTPLVFCSALIKNKQKIFFENKKIPEKIKNIFQKTLKYIPIQK